MTKNYFSETKKHRHLFEGFENFRIDRQADR
jgi:hypothetical protein